MVIIVLICSYFLYHYGERIANIPFAYFIMTAIIAIAALLYYGLLPGKTLKLLNLRNIGWLKPFIIGLVWSGVVSVFPLIMYRLEVPNSSPASLPIIAWFFLKNWMFCTVNAIIFDIKDYEDDTNKQLKTFVVRFGIDYTIKKILLPLTAIGWLALLVFTHHQHFPLLRIVINSVPFLLLLLLIRSMRQRRSLLFYLIIIDGLVMLKGICGILGILLTQ